MYLVKAEESSGQAGANSINAFDQRPPSGVAALLLRVWQHWKVHVRRQRSRAAKREMFILETLVLGPKQRLVLMKCGAERFLVGTGVEGVSTVVRVEPSQADEAIPLPAVMDHLRR